MSKRPDPIESPPGAFTRLSSIGVVVHPTRDIHGPLHVLRDWSSGHGIELLQVSGLGRPRELARLAEAGECDLIVSIGGDGTMLAAVRAAAAANRPVLGIACGSLGVLTTVDAHDVARALERVRDGDWVPRALPALSVARENREDIFALNDVAIVRSGDGQVHATAVLDGVMFGRFVGDGYVVSTPTGSSGYALAAGGPLLAPGTAGFLLTPLSAHGGRCPPIVIAADSELQLDAVAGHGGARLEVDGQVADTSVGPLTISFRRGVATIVGFADQEPLLTGLRRRRIIIDSPRVLAEDMRS